VRQDETIGNELRGTQAWDRDPDTGEVDEVLDARVGLGDEIVDGKLRVHSLSGHERNKLYLNEGNGANFSNQSGFSGLDDEADGRAFAFLDYDRDGWNDFVLVNAMNPLTRLFRNEMNDGKRKGHSIAISLEGGNQSAKPSSEWSNRDGYGARVTVIKGSEVIGREHRCGQGYGSQNSATMLIGIGDWDQVDQVIVQWPSGKKTIAHSVQEGEWLTLRERGGEERRSYRRQVVLNEERQAGAGLFPLRLKSSARLTVWKGMATWCPACARYRAHFEQLKLKTEDLGVSFLAFPLDENEENETLKAYGQSNDLPYQLLSNLSDLDRKRALVFLQRWIGAAELPSPTSLVTNERGEIVWVGAGAPTVSDLRRLLDEGS